MIVELDKVQLTVLTLLLLGLGAASGMAYMGLYGFQEVYFQSADGPEKQIGFQDPRLGFGVVCEISTQDQVKIADDAYRYNGSTSCRYVDGSLQQKWHNQSFTSYNVYEAVQCMQRTGNRTKCIPE